METKFTYQEEKALRCWTVDGVVLCLLPPTDWPKHFCGYCIFESRPVKEEDYSGILTYVPVHGGITYAKLQKDGRMVYGFDCGHSGDDSDPRMTDTEWLGEECDRMAKAIARAAEFEDAYLTADKENRAKVVDEYHESLVRYGIKFDLQDNFGAMINVIFGKI